MRGLELFAMTVALQILLWDPTGQLLSLQPPFLHRVGEFQRRFYVIRSAIRRFATGEHRLFAILTKPKQAVARYCAL